MAEKLEYRSEIIMDTFKEQIDRVLGEGIWQGLTDGIGVPDINNEAKCGCKTMRAFMERLDASATDAQRKAILPNVRHGLKREQFAWAKEKFAKYNNIDAYLAASYEESVAEFRGYCERGEDFYGQPITKEALAFLIENPEILVGRREGNKLYACAFPFDMVHFLTESDPVRKRYFACHCPFARESILLGKEVSKTLCYCSLGHVKVMWDAIFDRELEGEVLESALGGDFRCRYVIDLPDDIVMKYT